MATLLSAANSRDLIESAPLRDQPRSARGLALRVHSEADNVDFHIHHAYATLPSTLVPMMARTFERAVYADIEHAAVSCTRL